MTDETVDVIIVGSGAAALAAALRAAARGLSVLILEKSDLIGGTSAMSGGGTWIPANHHAKAAGIDDSRDQALTYLRAASPTGWAAQEDRLWQAFVNAAPDLLIFLEEQTPLRFQLINEPDPMAEYPGGKSHGRMLSPRALSRRLVGSWAQKIRRSTIPHCFTYGEIFEFDPYHAPLRTGLKLAPKLLRRWLLNEAGQGSALVVGLLKGCLDKGCRVETEAPVDDLILAENGDVGGVVIGGRRGQRHVAARKAVVLATGGFEWDPAMLAAHFPGAIDRLGSPRSNTGDGQRLAKRAGAKLDRMDQANIYPTLPVRYEGELQGIPVTFQAEPHAIVVNGRGERFCSEYDYNLGEALDLRDPESGAPVNLPAWVIADSRFLRRSSAMRWYAAKDPNWIKQAPTLEALAALIDVPSAALMQTAARFNTFCRSGRDEDFQRGEKIWERYKAGIEDNQANTTLGPIDRPPYIAMSFNRSILGTKGGARTNEHGQVLREDGSIIAGLYCAGNAMANPIGTRALGAGTTIGPCLTWGYICANAIAGSDHPPASTQRETAEVR